MTEATTRAGADGVWVVAFDFTNTQEHRISLAGAADAMAAGQFVWIDIDINRTPDTARILADLDIHDEIIEDALADEVGTQHARYPNCLHMVMSGCRIVDTEFELQRVDVVFGDKFLVTCHHGAVTFVDNVKSSFHEDFLLYAQTPSFLIYELWDHLVDRYIAVQNAFEERVEMLQAKLTGEIETDVFAQISELGSDLLELRKVLLPARSVLGDLAMRRSRFISEATQPFLANLSGTVERVLQDLLVDRELLSDSLNLYMSAVSHRTNEVMRRLTVVSVIFLPLTFLVGVYGMNFDYQPELRWHIGYALFWLVAGGITVGLIWLMRRHRLL